jgi:hypothetical protein
LDIFRYGVAGSFLEPSFEASAALVHPGDLSGH